MNRKKTRKNPYWLKFYIYIAVERGKGQTCVAAPSGILVLVLAHYLNTRERSTWPAERKLHATPFGAYRLLSLNRPNGMTE